MAETTEPWHVHVADACSLQAVGKFFAVKLRIMSRSRDSANVDNLLHIVFSKKADEVLYCARRMAYGKNDK
jgi:hypothetical protein